MSKKPTGKNHAILLICDGIDEHGHIYTCKNRTENYGTVWIPRSE